MLCCSEVGDFGTEQDIRNTLDAILGISLMDSNWLQSGLPFRYGGLGIKNPSMSYSSAYFSASLAEYSGAFSPSGDTLPPSDELWASARELATRADSPGLSQWLAQEALPAPE